jgi:hypothetical protein
LDSDPDLEAVLGEPSDELPMVLGRKPIIVPFGDEFQIYSDDRRELMLNDEGRWESYRGQCKRWPSRASAITFLLECAAPAASEPQERITADVASTEERDRVAADCMVRGVPQTMIGWAIEQLEKRRPAPAPQAEPTT